MASTTNRSFGEHSRPPAERASRLPPVSGEEASASELSDALGAVAVGLMVFVALAVSMLGMID